MRGALLEHGDAGDLRTDTQHGCLVVLVACPRTPQSYTTLRVCVPDRNAQTKNCMSPCWACCKPPTPLPRAEVLHTAFHPYPSAATVRLCVVPCMHACMQLQSVQERLKIDMAAEAQKITMSEASQRAAMGLCQATAQ